MIPAEKMPFATQEAEVAHAQFEAMADAGFLGEIETPADARWHINAVFSDWPEADRKAIASEFWKLIRASRA